MAGRATSVITEDDDLPGGGERVIATNGADEGELVDVGGASTPEGAGQRRQPQQQPEPEFDIIEGEDEQEPEGRLTQQEAGERPLLERQAAGRVYSRDEVQAMSAEERRQLWRGMSRDEQKANRALNRARTKDQQHRGREETGMLRRQVADMSVQINELTRQVGGFAPRFTEFQKQQITNEIRNVDGLIAEENRKFEAARLQIKQALGDRDADPAEAADRLSRAMDDRDQAFLRRAQAMNRKAQLENLSKAPPQDGGRPGDDNAAVAERQPERQQQQPEQLQLSPDAVERVEDFAAKYPWYDPQAFRNPKGDLDSKIVASLDSDVFARGFRPESEDYWEELEDLMREYLPHRFDDGRAPAAQRNGRAAPAARAVNGNGRAQVAPMRRGPPTGGGGEGAQRGNRIQVRMTNDRRDALIEAGVMDRSGTILNRDKYVRLMKAYGNQDRESAGARR